MKSTLVKTNRILVARYVCNYSKVRIYVYTIFFYVKIVKKERRKEKTNIINCIMYVLFILECEKIPGGKN